ncbi:MAG: arsenate reductase (glutaredoxin) [Bacteroidia bacterium]
MELYHNPRCSTSRASLALLNEKGIVPEIHEYLKSIPTAAELRALIAMLGIPPHDLIRQNEDIYKENYKGKKLSDDKWIEAMVKHPILIQRPIFIHNGKAVIGRPPERVLELL